MIVYKIKLDGEQKGFNSVGPQASVNSIYPSSKMVKMTGMKAFKTIKKSLEAQFGTGNVIQGVEGEYTTLEVNA